MSDFFGRLMKELESGEVTEQMREDIDAVAIDYVTSEMRHCPMEGWTEIGWSLIEKRRNMVISDYRKRGLFNEALKDLIRTKNIETYLMRLLPVKNTLTYLVYPEFWLSRTEETGEPEFPYYNAIIGMRWWKGHDTWVATKIEDSKRVVDYQKGTMIALPPTKEMIAREYKEIQEGRINEG